MAATLAQLREQTAFWLDDPKLTKFDEGFLETILNIAYPLLVQVVESCGRLWNMSRGRIPVVVGPTAREYVIDATYGVRRPIMAHRVEGITTKEAITATARRTPLSVRPFTESHTSAPYPALENSYVGEWIYFYRNPVGQSLVPEWMLGFEAHQPRSQVVEVTYIPSVETLATDFQYPTMVPQDFHHLIAMRAAMMAKGVENRLNEQVIREYADGVGLMINELSSLTAHRSQRF